MYDSYFAPSVMAPQPSMPWEDINIVTCFTVVYVLTLVACVLKVFKDDITKSKLWKYYSNPKYHLVALLVASMTVYAAEKPPPPTDTDVAEITYAEPGTNGVILHLEWSDEYDLDGYKYAVQTKTRSSGVGDWTFITPAMDLDTTITTIYVPGFYIDQDRYFRLAFSKEVNEYGELVL